MPLAAKRRHNPLKAIRPENCLTPNEAAKRMGVVPLTIRNWIKKGRIRAAQGENGYFWIKRKDLDQFWRDRYNSLDFKFRTASTADEAANLKPRSHASR